MRISHFFIDRPIFAAVVSIVFVIIGGVSFFRLPIAQYPEIAPPIINVSGQYPGASADVVAATVVTPIEQQINGVENMLYVSSNSTADGRFTISVTFDLGTNLDIAQVQVQNRVAIAEPRLPQDVRNIGVTVTKSSPDIMMVVHLYSPDKSRDTLFISNYATLEIVDPLTRDLHVLALQGAGDVGGGQTQRLQAVRVEPCAHGIIAAAEHDDRADPVDAGERIDDLERRVIGDEQRVARFVGRIEMHDHHDVGRAFGDRDADIAHVLRQARLGDRDAVLHLHLGDIEVGAEVEGHRNREAAVGGRVRRDIEHVLDAVDLLLDRRDHGRGHHVGAGAGVLPGYVDDGRRDLGILRDRQAEEGYAADDHEHDRDDGGEDRPVDEEVRDAHGGTSRPWWWDRPRSPARPSPWASP